MDQTTDLIGSSPRRVEDRRLLVGAGRYLDDMTREGLLHLGVVRSPHGHARVRAIDTREARTRPGVVAAWSAADLPEAARPILASADGAHKGRPFAARVLAGDVVRYVGECVAVVVADDPYRVADAIERVAVDYEPLPALVSAEDALGSGTRLHADWPDNAAVVARGGMGDAERALAAADVVVSEHFRHARLAAVYVETRGGVAYRERTPAGWSSGPPRRTRTRCGTRSRHRRGARRGGPGAHPRRGGRLRAQGRALPGGGAGRPAAHRLGRPVKWVESRREDFQASGHDREQSHQVKIGFGKDGTIAGIDASFLADVGAYPAAGQWADAQHREPPARAVPGRALPERRHERRHQQDAQHGLSRRRPPRGRLRDGAPHGHRRAPPGPRPRGDPPPNLVRPAEMPYRPGLTYKDGVAISYDPGDFPAAFERALGLLGYDDWRRRQAAQPKDTTRRIGVGLACYAQGTGLGPFEGSTVRVDPSGKVYVLIGVAAQGQGHATTLAQICAQELGAAFEDVIVQAGDTTLFPFGMGTGGSRVMVNAGPAVASTARAVREQGRPRRRPSCSSARPPTCGSRRASAFVTGMPTRTVPLGRLAQAAVQLERSSHRRARASTPAPTTIRTPSPGPSARRPPRWRSISRPPRCGCSATQWSHDPGRAINPMIVEAQLQGGAVQGDRRGVDGSRRLRRGRPAPLR